MGCNFIADLYEYLSWSEIVPWVYGGTPLDWLWFLPPALVLGTMMIKYHDQVEEGERLLREFVLNRSTLPSVFGSLAREALEIARKKSASGT